MDDELIRQEKQRIRRLMREKKRLMTQEEISRFSAVLTGKLLASEEYQRAGKLFIYLSCNQEVRTEEIIRKAWSDGKCVAVPRIDEGFMSFRQIDSLEGLERDRMGIRQPGPGAPEVSPENGLVIVPGLAFDHKGGRLGYGGGYYDRFLRKNPEVPSIALCYDFQVLDSLPEGEYDRPVGRVIAVSRDYKY